jgi:hypothetical protein
MEISEVQVFLFAFSSFWWAILASEMNYMKQEHVKAVGLFFHSKELYTRFSWSFGLRLERIVHPDM